MTSTCTHAVPPAMHLISPANLPCTATRGRPRASFAEGILTRRCRSGCSLGQRSHNQPATCVPLVCGIKQPVRLLGRRRHNGHLQRRSRLLDEVDCLSNCRLDDHELRYPRWQAVVDAHALVARLDQRACVQEVVTVCERVEEVGVLKDARHHRVHCELRHLLQRALGDGWAHWDAGARHEVLLHQVHAPHQKVGVAHRAAAHAAVDLDEARPARCVLALHVEHTEREPQRLHTAHAQLRKLNLLFTWQDRRAVGPGLVEVGLHGRPIVSDGAIPRLPAVEDEVAVDLVAIQVLLQHEHRLDPAARVAGLAALDALHERACHDARLGHVRHDARIRSFEVLQVVDANHADRCGARHGLDDRREADVRTSLLYVLRLLDAVVQRRGQAGLFHHGARRVLVPRVVDRLHRIVWQPEDLREAR
mmetsp:Transcript_41777/g.124958  ORF Transcript_41777/g.124958 Transcript_41777/m.124958 type:complete len:420 (-) Transcript_41777:305-1564(-)